VERNSLRATKPTHSSSDVPPGRDYGEKNFFLACSNRSGSSTCVETTLNFSLSGLNVNLDSEEGFWSSISDADRTVAKVGESGRVACFSMIQNSFGMGMCQENNEKLNLGLMGSRSALTSAGSLLVWSSEFRASPLWRNKTCQTTMETSWRVRDA